MRRACGYKQLVQTTTSSRHLHAHHHFFESLTRRPPCPRSNVYTRRSAISTTHVVLPSPIRTSAPTRSGRQSRFPPSPRTHSRTRPARSMCLCRRTAGSRKVLRNRPTSQLLPHEHWTKQDKHGMPAHSHLNPITDSVTSPVIGRYASITYTVAMLVPWEMENVTTEESVSENGRATRTCGAGKELTESQANGGTDPVQLVRDSHAVQDKSQRRRYHGDDHGRKPHFRIPDAAIA